MKKLLIAVTAVLSTAVFAQGALKPVAGARVDKNTKLPYHWLAQAQKADKETVKTNVNEKGLSKSVVLAPVKASMEFFGNEIPFQKGDEFKLTAKVKGKGKVAFGYFGYTTASKYIFLKIGKTIELTGAEQTISETFTAQDGKEFPLGKIRPVLRIFKDSTCEISSIVLTEE